MMHPQPQARMVVESLCSLLASSAAAAAAATSASGVASAVEMHAGTLATRLAVLMERCQHVMAPAPVYQAVLKAWTSVIKVRPHTDPFPSFPPIPSASLFSVCTLLLAASPTCTPPPFVLPADRLRAPPHLPPSSTAPALSSCSAPAPPTPSCPCCLGGRRAPR